MILFVDDEKRGINTHVEELKLSGYEVVFIKDVDSAFEYLKENYPEIKLIILDVMMPPGRLFKDSETRDGMTTGISFHQKIRQEFPALPIIIFTNYNGDELEQQIGQDSNSKLLNKIDYLPFELVEEVKEFLHH